MGRYKQQAVKPMNYWLVNMIDVITNEISVLLIISHTTARATPTDFLQ